VLSLLRILCLLPFVFVALSVGANGGGVHIYSGNFSYSSEAAPHLGGDDFAISSLRIDYGANRAERATVTAFGRIESLQYFEVTAERKPSLPVPKPEPARPAGAPPVVVEGQGPVGIAAEGSAMRRIKVRIDAPSDPTVMRVRSGWQEYRATLEAQLGPKIAEGSVGVYLRLEALGTGSNPAGQTLTKAEVNQHTTLSNLFAAPFALMPIGGSKEIGALHPALQLKVGQSRLINFSGRAYSVTRYDLR
jgi:hypothetical protein